MIKKLLGGLVVFWRSKDIKLPGPIKMRVHVNKHLDPSVTFKKDEDEL